MKIINEYPPNFDTIKIFFNLTGKEIFAYDDAIFNPTGVNIDVPLQKHEEVHLRQQKDIGVEKWWNRYCVDPYFRASQEVEAYQVQYQEGMKIITDRNKKARYLDSLATELSSELYGKCMTYSDAIQAIQQKNPIRFRID